MDLVTLDGLGKRYPGAGEWALSEVTLALEEGAVCGLIGANGAGKTTLIRLLLGLIRPSAGAIRVSPGVRVGYVPELPSPWPTLTAREHLTAVGRGAGLSGRLLASAVERVLDQVDLTTKANGRTSTLSRGMLQRLAIGQALLPDPQLMVMDEPAGGLDPAGQKGIRDLIGSLNAQGRTILLSSHYLSEIERVCTGIAVLHNGRVVLEQPIRETILRHRHRVQMELNRDPGCVVEDLRELGIEFSLDGHRLLFEELDDDAYFGVMSVLSGAGLRVLSLGYPGPLLEGVFLDAVRSDE